MRVPQPQDQRFNGRTHAPPRSRRITAPVDSLDFANSTELDSGRLLRFCRDMTDGWRIGEVTVRVRYSRGAEFSGACYYVARRIFINVGRHLRYPYLLRTNLARAKSTKTHWYREAYTLELADAYQLVQFIFLHELYHLLIKVARRNRRQKEGMCDRFAAGMLVDRFGVRVRDYQGRPVPREAWDFQDLEGFVAAARHHRRQSSTPCPQADTSSVQLTLF